MKILTIGSISAEITDLEAIFSNKRDLIVKLKSSLGNATYNFGFWTFDYSKLSDIIIEAESQYSNYHIKIVNKYSNSIPENSKEIDDLFYYIIEGSKF